MELMELIKEKRPLFLDGAMGTGIEARGEKPGKHLNLEENPVVTDIHEEYLKAGADIIIANTFVLNRIYDITHNGDGDLKEACVKGVKLAKKAVEKSGKTAFVLGDMTGTGQMLEPYGDYEEEEFVDNFAEQAGYLIEAGADGIIIETMFDLNETVCAVRGVKKVSEEIPVFVSMTYNTVANGGRTFMGASAEQCATTLEEEGIAAIGANCGDLKPDEVAEIVKIYKQNTDLPVFVEPNAGLPEMEDGKPVFKMSVDTFAQGVKLCYEAGADILGGCCGTTPEHIAAAYELISQTADR